MIFMPDKTSQDRMHIGSAYLCERKTWPPFWAFAAELATCPASKYYQMGNNVLQKQLLLTFDVYLRIWRRNDSFPWTYRPQIQRHFESLSFPGPTRSAHLWSQIYHPRHVWCGVLWDG